LSSIFAERGNLDVGIRHRKLRAQAKTKHYWIDQREWASGFVLKWRDKKREYNKAATQKYKQETSMEKQDTKGGSTNQCGCCQDRLHHVVKEGLC
jgi:hypothetical protein